MKFNNKFQPYILCFTGIISIFLIIFCLNIGTYAESATVSAVKTKKVASKANLDLPVLFQIPKIKVNAKVEHVGILNNGTMGVPKGPKEVAWFNLGPRPGEKGSSVIDGHSGWKNGIPAVFDNLYKLRVGDKISVKNGKGVTTNFIVVKIKLYNPTADAASVFSSSDGKAHLNLITCTGTWDKVKKTHSDRLVVFTDKIEPI